MVVAGVPVLHIARVGEKAKCRPALRLRLGSTYYFRVECEEGFMFTSHAYGGSGADVYPLPGTRHAVKGEVFTFTATADHPRSFYYGSMHASYMGGSIEIY